MDTLLETLAAKAKDHPPTLPLKLLVVADCGCPEGSETPIEVEGGVSALMGVLGPGVKLTAENKLQKGAPRIALDLSFRSLADFRPESLVSRIDLLSEAARAGNPGLGEQLDGILHHPEYQKTEACWLGLDRLFDSIDSRAGVRLQLLHATKRNLRERFHRLVFEPEYEGTVPVPLAAVFFDFRFSHEQNDLALLEALAGDCAMLQSPMVAAVHPGFFQLKNLAHLPNLPDIAGQFQLPAYAGWRKFQAAPPARWVCLTANRFLAREPHALAGGQDFPLEYRESADAAHPEKYLWAEAGWLVFSNLARSFSRYRHCTIIDGMTPETMHTALPTRPFPKKANVSVPSPTEILIDDDKAWNLVRGGITMLVGISDGAVATFPFISNVYRLRQGVLTTESALSYQLFAGHLAHYLAALYPELPADSGTETILAFVKEKLSAFLLPFTQDKPEDSVEAEVVGTAGDPKGRYLNLRLKPLLKMQGKDVDFTLQIAL